MKQVFITGITGFAGSHLAELLLSQGQFDVSGTYISENTPPHIDAIKDKVDLIQLNLLDKEKVHTVIKEKKPDIIYHLAAVTSVGKSFAEPLETIMNNTAAQLHVLEGVRLAELFDTKIIITSSAHVYGYVTEKDLPINEQVAFKPDSPYAVSKITQDYLALEYYLAYKLKIIRVRPFNHLGPRLSPDISISRFAKGIAEIEKGLKEPVLTVGNLEAKRDFTDVRDMVRAYMLAVEKAVDGEEYNIGSGVSYSIDEMLTRLLALSTTSITVKQDPALLRPSDIPELRADASKFHNATGWKPEIPIEQTLQDTLDYWRKVIYNS